MRTSNKILLGTFLTAILVFTLIHITLYAKYKNGSFTTVKSIREDQFVHHDIKNVNKIVATGMENMNIYPSDTARLDIEKSEYGFVRFEVKGDVLIIHGDSGKTTIDDPYNIRSYQRVNVYLPSIEKISGDYSEIHIKGATDSSKAQSYDIDLRNRSSFDFKDNEDDRDTSYTYFKNFNIRSDKSEIGFARYSMVAGLNLVMIGSDFHDNSGKIEKLTIQLDNISGINMRGDNLQKAEIIK